ncbi:MAG: DUF4178 domain-containing protein [Acaryochloridaceae cyanobacterium RU_4_10]|nr:DUF4178 domain-containing protein [Acaryochloridaceae cyanobacterium RU_4_10]
MATILTGETLQDLKEGDRITYHGVRWQVCDRSTYKDDKGYTTQEWLLKSTTGKEYYLLQETDPSNSEGSVQWYLAEELQHPTLLNPETQEDVLTRIPERMKLRATPYPALQLFNRSYQFESQTDGTYNADGETRQRITWDYWDKSHLWNLALEGWDNGVLHLYSTREVQPEEFSEYITASELRFWQSSAYTNQLSESQAGFESREIQFIVAWGLVILGFFLMLAGV